MADPTQTENAWSSTRDEPQATLMWTNESYVGPGSRDRPAALSAGLRNLCKHTDKVTSTTAAERPRGMLSSSTCCLNCIGLLILWRPLPRGASSTDV